MGRQGKSRRKKTEKRKETQMEAVTESDQETLRTAAWKQTGEDENIFSWNIELFDFS